MNIELSKRAVACKHWRWMPGMLTTHYSRIVCYLGTEAEEDVFEFVFNGRMIISGLDEGELPDLDDTATLGCLLALVREVWDEPTLFVQAYGSIWSVCNEDGDLLTDYSTESLALVAALEAAP